MTKQEGRSRALYSLAQHENSEQWCITRFDNLDLSRMGRNMDKASAEALWHDIEHGSRCRECDEPLAYWRMFGSPDVVAKREADRLCFSCAIWVERLPDNDPSVARVEGYRYVVKPDIPTNRRDCAGHGGARFVIRFHDGREIVTHNLWATGPIPLHLRERLPDNAVFVETASSSAYVGCGSANNHPIKAS